MPLYEYVCRECQEKFEKLVLRVSDDSPVACPRCGCSPTERVFSTFSTSGGGSSSASGGCVSGGRFT